MKVLNEFPGSHHYWRRYEKRDLGLHCPGCGKDDEIWEEQDEGDYYHGADNACANCGCVFTYRSRMSADPNELNIIRQLREKTTMEPTTRRGQ